MEQENGISFWGTGMVMSAAPFSFFDTIFRNGAFSIESIVRPHGELYSIGIELTQVFLPTRDSSLLDVFDNTVGTGVGILLFAFGLPMLKKFKVFRKLLL